MECPNPFAEVGIVRTSNIVGGREGIILSGFQITIVTFN
jgi:hypothetical protein